MAANDRPPLISAVIAKDIVECRRLIDTGEANVNEDRGQSEVSLEALLYMKHPLEVT